MYTAEDIRNMEFGKNMGGYKAAEVDAFLDSCADTVQTLTAEKEELNKKMSILADKLVEYRRDEDSIRSALLTAQRMGDATLREAKEEAAKIIATAKDEAKKEALELQEQIQAQQAELERVKKEVSDFKANILSLYKEHLALLKNVPEVKAQAVPEQPQPEEEPVQVAEPVTVAPVKDETTAEVPKEPSVSVAPVEQPTRSKFVNLKFGADYNMDDDDEDAND